MTIKTVSINSRTQTIKLPAGMHYPDTVKEVNIRAVSNERIISPAENTWDSFFMADNITTTEDFMSGHANQTQKKREAL